MHIQVHIDGIKQFCLHLKSQPVCLTLSLQAKVQEYYKEMNELVTETYSDEDQQIIGCPSIQQVS